MRWNNLFDDLEGQLEHGLTAEDADLAVEEERLRLGRLSMRDRLVALHAAAARDPSWAVRLMLRTGEPLSIRPVAFGRDWVSADVVDESARKAQCVIPLAAIAMVSLERAQVEWSLQSTEPPGPGRGLTAGLGLAVVLRDLCRRRRAIELRLDGRIGGLVHGTIDRVGRDHVDLALHERGTPRREAEVAGFRIVPLAQIVVVRV